MVYQPGEPYMTSTCDGTFRTIFKQVSQLKKNVFVSVSIEYKLVIWSQ